MNNNLLLLLVPQIIISYGLTWALRNWAIQLNMIDIPNERSSHAVATPRGGGVAIVLTVIVSVIILAVITNVIHTREVLVFLFGSSLIAIVGLLDDRKSLSARHRFATQIIVALVTVSVLGYPTRMAIPLVGGYDIGAFGAVVVVVWIVGFINAYNFMDGIDGIAAGTGIVVAFGWLALFGLSFSPNPVIIVLTIAVMGGCVGFLGHNWQPARIFMGDAGSTFLGYTFAVLPLMLTETQTQSLTSAAMLTWPFLFDAGITFLHRLITGKNVFAAHREHIYQKLVTAGFSHSLVAALYMVMALLGIVFAGAYLETSYIVLLAPFILGACLFYISHLLTTRYRLLKR
jgi:UDP-N-acetylmuramyl pentapeptide phosphotransferase/UDP-N-acetylglucosamine-1-phosphate transferase